jgi:hypothetical protein
MPARLERAWYRSVPRGVQTPVDRVTVRRPRARPGPMRVAFSARNLRSDLPARVPAEGGGGCRVTKRVSGKITAAAGREFPWRGARNSLKDCV